MFFTHEAVVRLNDIYKKKEERYYSLLKNAIKLIALPENIFFWDFNVNVCLLTHHFRSNIKCCSIHNISI